MCRCFRDRVRNQAKPTAAAAQWNLTRRWQNPICHILLQMSERLKCYVNHHLRQPHCPMFSMGLEFSQIPTRVPGALTVFRCKKGRCEKVAYFPATP